MHNNLLALNELALRCLDREEYANFLTVMSKIRDRSKDLIPENTEINQEENLKKYSHDLELVLETKIYRNNHKGERVELEQYKEIPFLIKVPIGDDPLLYIKYICKFIDNPW